MANKKSFISTVVDGKSFNISIGVGKSFDTSLSYQKTFSLDIFGFNATASWILNINQGLQIVGSFIQKLRLFLDMVIDTPSIDITETSIKFIERFLVDWDIDVPVIAGYLESKVMVYSLPITIPVPIMNLLTKLREKIYYVDLSIPTVVIDTSILVRQFHHLYEYDPDLLWEMDGQTLADLDYTIV